jgi:flagellar motility protein MotE (MotC chaperone)
MTRILKSGWFAALLGCVLYLATTIFVLSPSKFAGAQFIQPDYSADDDPSWRFRNPEFNQWVSQIQDEKEKLDLREQQLNEWQTRLNLELQEMSLVTETVNQLQSNFDKNVVLYKTQEVANVKRQVKLISAMSPEGAVNMINEMSDDEVVRILFTMKPDEASLILDTLSKMGPDEAKRAALLTERLHEVLPEPVPSNASATTLP